MSEVGKVKGGFSGIPGIGETAGSYDGKTISTSKDRTDIDSSREMETSPLWRHEAGYVVRDPLVYGPLTREETERDKHNNAMEREDRAQLMSLLQGQGFISEKGICNEPSILEYFNDEIGGVDRLIKSINESDTSYTPDGKARLYTADKDGITINFKVRGDYKVNSEEMKGTELIKLSPPLKLSWKDVVVWATEKPYSDRRPLPNGELPAENLMYLFFPEFENTLSLSGSKSKNIQSVLMNGCIIYETRFLYLEGTAFKYARAQLEGKIAGFEKKGNEKAAAGAKNALQYLDLIRDWASKNEVSFKDSLDKKLPENVLRVLDRIITDAGEAKVSDKELQQADLLLKIITPETIDEADRFLKDSDKPTDVKLLASELAGKVGTNKRDDVNRNNIADGAAAVGDKRDNSKEVETLMDGLRNINEMVEGTLKEFRSIPMKNGKISKENLDSVKRSLSLVENAVKLADDPRVRKYTTSSDYTEASSKLNAMIENIFANVQEVQRIGNSLLTKIHAKKKK